MSEESTTTGTELPSFADLWPARELGAWIVAILDGSTEPSIEAPFAKALGHWLRARRDAGLLRTMGFSSGRIAWQISAWNDFVHGSDDIKVRQMLVDLAHALNRGIVATEWALDAGIDPTRGADVAAMHARIVRQIEAGETDPVTAPWNVHDRHTRSTVSIVFHQWRPIVSLRVWDEMREVSQDALPVRDEGVGLKIGSARFLVVDPTLHPKLDKALVLHDPEVEERPREAQIAYDRRLSDTHGLAIVRSEEPLEVLQSDDRNVVVFAKAGTSRDGFRRIGTMSPSDGRLVVGDLALIWRATGHDGKPDDLLDEAVEIRTTKGTWFLHGPDEGPSNDPRIDHAMADETSIAVISRLDPDAPFGGVRSVLDRLIGR